MGWFDGKVAWVTGGSSGIGAAVAVALARHGADVAISARREDRLAATAQAIEAAGRRALCVPCDVVDDAQVRAAVARVVGELGSLDITVANAGMSVMGRFESLTDEQWRRQIDINLNGVASTARHSLPELHKTQGRLALVASVSGMICIPGGSAYSASKFAVRALGLTLSQELHGSGVSCTTIHPGFVASEITQVDNDGQRHPERRDPRPGALMWSAEAAAEAMVRAIHRRQREYVFTGHGKIGAWLGRHLPGLVHFAVTRSSRRR